MSNVVFTGISQEIGRVNHNLKVRWFVVLGNLICGAIATVVCLRKGICNIALVVTINMMSITLQLLYIRLAEHHRAVINRLNDSKCKKDIRVSDNIVEIECFYERFSFRKKGDVTGKRKLICNIYEHICEEE